MAYQWRWAEWKIWRIGKASRVHFFQWFSKLIANSYKEWVVWGRDYLYTHDVLKRLVHRLCEAEKQILRKRILGPPPMEGEGRKQVWRRGRRKSCSAVQSQKRPQQTQQRVWKLGWAFRVVLNNSWAGPLYPLVYLILDAWTRWPSLADTIHKEGWQLRALPKPREVSHSFLKGLSWQHPLGIVSYFRTSRRWEMPCG